MGQRQQVMGLCGLMVLQNQLFGTSDPKLIKQVWDLHRKVCNVYTCTYIQCTCTCATCIYYTCMYVHVHVLHVYTIHACTYMYMYMYYMYIQYMHVRTCTTCTYVYAIHACTCTCTYLDPSHPHGGESTVVSYSLPPHTPARPQESY